MITIVSYMYKHCKKKMPFMCLNFWINLLLARLGSLVGLAVPESIPRTSGGSMGFPKYRLKGSKQEVNQI